MTTPNGIPGGADGDDFLVRAIKDLQRQITELAASVGKGGFVSQGFDGDLDAPSAGTTGWGLGGKSGNAVFNNITLRGHLIQNDALAPVADAALVSPMKGVVANSSAAGANVAAGSYSLTTTSSISVPAGFSQAQVMAVGYGTASNASGGATLVHCRINGVDGADAVTFFAAGAGSATSPFASIVTGLPSDGTGSIPVSVLVGGAGSGTFSGITGRLSVTALFFR